MDFQIFRFSTPATWRACQDVTGTLERNIFVFEFGGCWPCFEKRQQLSKHCHQHHYWEFEDLSFYQTFSANSSNTPIKSELRPVPPDCWVFAWTFWPPSLYYSISLQIWYLDFCPWWFLHFTAEEDTIPVDHCDPRGIQPSWCGLHFHSCPVPPRFSTALYSEVKLFKPSSWSYFITTKAQFVPWVCISFLQLKPSETHSKFGPEDF